jgi:hypothetical protein
LETESCYVVKTGLEVQNLLFQSQE